MLPASSQHKLFMHLIWFYIVLLIVAGTCGHSEGLSGSINAGNFLTGCKVYRLASQEGLCCME